MVTKQTRQVAHLFSRVDGWTQEWGVPVESQRRLLKNFADVMEAEGDKSVAVKALVLPTRLLARRSSRIMEVFG